MLTKVSSAYCTEYACGTFVRMPCPAKDIGHFPRSLTQNPGLTANVPIRPKHRRGFTLIEVVIVAAMSAVVALAIYSTLSNGLRIWKRINTGMPREDTAIFFDKLGSDVRNAFICARSAFSGGRDMMKIPTRVAAPWLRAKTAGTVSYVYDAGAKTLYRSRQNYSQLYLENDGLRVASVTNVDAVEFRYYSFDAEKKEYGWVSEWHKDTLPLAVRVELTLHGQTQPVTKTIPCMVGSMERQK